jgi:O-antigen/teichoic acid export membrane protein
VTIRSIWLRALHAGPFAANATLTAATNVVLAALGMVSGILAARLLGPHGRGELAAIQIWPSSVATLAMLGMPEAVVYFSAREPSRAGRYLSSAMIVALASSVPFMAAAFPLMPLLLRAQAPAIIRAGQWYLAIVPIFALVGMLVYPLRGLGDFTAWNVMRLMPNTLWIAVLILAWALSHPAPIFLAAANLAALAFLMFPFTALVIRRVPGPFTPDPERLPRMVYYGFPCMMTSMPQILNLRLDQMLMAALLPPRDLGLYMVAVAWSGAAAPLLNAVGAATTPAVASAPDHAAGARRMAAGARTTAALALIVCLALAIITPFAIMILFGGRFRPSIPAALVLIPAAGVLGLNLVLQEGLRGMGRPYAAFQAEMAGLAVTAIALAAMLRPLGIMGAAIASFLGYSTVLAGLVINACRHAGVSSRELLMPRPSEIRIAVERLLSLVCENPRAGDESLTRM